MRAAALILLATTCAADAATCSLSAGPMAFGSYNSTALTALDSQSTMTVSCQSGLLELVSYSLALSAGSSGSTAARQLASGSNRLSYNLYKDVARLTLWGTGSDAYASTLQLLTVLTPNNTTLTVYGRIPARQSAAAPGSYSDAITATLTF